MAVPAEIGRPIYVALLDVFDVLAAVVAYNADHVITFFFADGDGHFLSPLLWVVRSKYSQTLSSSEKVLRDQRAIALAKMNDVMDARSFATHPPSEDSMSQCDRQNLALPAGVEATKETKKLSAAQIAFQRLISTLTLENEG